MSLPQITHGCAATVEIKPDPGSPGTDEGRGGTPRYSFDIDMDAVSEDSSERQEEALISADSPGSPGRDPSLLLSETQEGDAAGKQWNYEDQFRQLYSLSAEPERKDFLDNLFDFMQKKGTPITRVPIMAKQPLDLYRLFKLVVERGGLVEVIKKKAWRNVAKELNLPASITSAAFTMRSQYVKYLYPFECEYKHLSDPQELQMAIESNKRDRRHSDAAEFSSPQPVPPTSRTESTRPVDQVPGCVPTTYAMATSQGLQLITSPTMAIPHGSMPPYPGSFIIPNPGIRPSATTSSQLVQMSTHSHLPIMMQAGGAAKDHLEDNNSNGGRDQDGELPPAKRITLDLSGKGQGTTGGTSFIIGAHHHTPSTPSHLLQMATHPHSQVPIIALPQGSPMITDPRSMGSRSDHDDDIQSGRKDTLHENGRIPIHHPASFVINTSKGAQLVQAASSPQLVHMVAHPHLPIVMPASFHNPFATTAATITPTEVPKANILAPSKPEPEANASSGVFVKSDHKPMPTATGSKMPFANISIQSHNQSGKESNSEGACDDSLLVTMEINNIIYQGVLFAKPSSTGSSPRR